MLGTANYLNVEYAMKFARMIHSATARWGTLALGAAILIGMAAAGCGTSTAETDTGHAGQVDRVTAAAANESAVESAVERGKYLVEFGGCNHCHTPMKEGPKGPESDMSRMLSGHPEGAKLPPPPKGEGPWGITVSNTFTAWSGPWGTTYTMNITPDSLTGIGTWTEDIFVKTIRTGKHWGTSRPIMPPMPWENYAKLPDEDLKAIYAYLRTIPPIRNQVPAYEPPTSAPLASADGAAPADAPEKGK